MLKEAIQESTLLQDFILCLVRGVAILVRTNDFQHTLMSAKTNEREKWEQSVYS
jgi:hypothetical protein